MSPQPAKENKIKKGPAKELLLVVILAAVMVFAGIAAFHIHSGNSTGRSGSETQSGDQVQLLVQELLSPDKVAVGDGKGQFCLMDASGKVTAGSFQNQPAGQLLTSVMQELFTRELQAEKISEKQYRKESSGRAAVLEYSGSVPFELFLKANDLKEPAGDTVSSVSCVVMTSEDGGTIYLYDKSAGSWYRLSSEKDDAVITSRFLRRLMTSASEKKDAQQVVPFSGTVWTESSAVTLAEDQSDSEKQSERSGLTALSDSPVFVPEYDPAKQKDRLALEQLFFPDGMDFIYQVDLPDGGKIDRSGNMDRMLRIDSGGGLIYQQETASDQNAPDLYDSLYQAVRYIRNHGGWPGAQQDDVSVILTGVSSVETETGKEDSSANGYRFTFSLQVQGIPLVYESGTQLSVVIGQDGITEYERDLPDLDTLYAEDSGQTEQNTTSAGGRSEKNADNLSFSSDLQSDLMNLQEVIKADSDRFETALADKGNSDSKSSAEDLQEEILKEISSAELQLLRTEDAGSAFSAEGLSADTEKKSSSAVSGSRSSERDADQNNETDTESSEKGLLPVWRICIHETVFEVSARTGRLLQEP